MKPILLFSLLLFTVGAWAQRVPYISPAMRPVVGAPTLLAARTAMGVLPTQVALTHSGGTVTLSFAPFMSDAYLILTGAVTLATSNLATNRTYALTITWPGSTNAPLTTPAWVWQGFAPTNLWPTNKTFTILLKARGANDTNVIAYFGGQL